MINIGERIKAYRNSLKMTPADFAYRLGVTGASVSAYENGTRLPSYEVLAKLSNILGVSTDTLLGCHDSDKIFLDVTQLTAKQRNIVQETINAFIECNQSKM